MAYEWKFNPRPYSDEEAKKILKDTGIGAERLYMLSEEEDITKFMEKLETLGINPLRKGKKVKK